MKSRQPVPGYAGLVLALAAAALILVWRLGPGDPVTDALEARLLDLRFKVRGATSDVPDEAVIVGLDETALAAAPGTAGRRLLLTRAVERIAAAGPAAVAIDLLLVEETGADAGLGQALGAVPGTVLAAASVKGAASAPLSPEVSAALERSVIRSVITRPGAVEGRVALTALPRAAFALTGRLGHVNIVESGDRVARALPPALPLGDGRWLPALPLVAAGMAGGQTLALDPGRAVVLGDRRVALEPGGRLVIDHLGPAGTIATLSLLDVAEGRVPPGVFAGRMVFVGSTAESLGDLYATPFGARVAGVEILATAAVNLFRGESIQRAGTPMALSALLALAAAALAALGAGLRNRFAAFGAAGGVALASAAALQGAFASGGMWLDATAVALSVTAGAAIGGVARMRAERRLSDALAEQRSNLARYVSPVMAESLAERPVPAFDRRRQQAAVLFVDVAGFTAMTERADPVDVAAFLRDLHGYFEAVAERHGGLVADYMGDGALIVFGLPDAGPSDRERALRAADTLADADDAPPGPDGAATRLRVSLHAGEVAAAVLGGQHQGHVSVTGDTVNVAARLQDCAKAEGVPLIFSDSVLEAASTAELEVIVLQKANLRGRREPVQLFARLKDVEGSISS